ncbi:MAG TPA: hypothetical protein VFH73_23020 [Polyangia bacterium]|nr:hypothetical protein [Polyangia bacterium]
MPEPDVPELVLPEPDVPLLEPELSIPVPVLPDPAPVSLLSLVDFRFLVRDFVDGSGLPEVLALSSESVPLADPGAAPAPGVPLPALDEPEVLLLPPEVELPAPELPLPDPDPAPWASTTAGCSNLV